MSEVGVAFTGQGMLWRFLRPAHTPRSRPANTALFSNALRKVKATAL